MGALSEDLDRAIHEARGATRWFVKAEIDGVSGYRPKKASLRDRFTIVRAPGGWAVDDAKTRDSASFRALDEIAAWIEEVAGEKLA